MARALSEILRELNPVYDPQRQIFRDQEAALPGEMDAEQKSLDAAKQDSFKEIETRSNRRGLFYSGIPIEEQATYTGREYLPAVANLKSRFAQRRFNIRDALAQLEQRAYQQAYGIYENELSREAQERAARSSGGGGGSLSFGGGGGAATPAASPDVTGRVQAILQRQYAANPNANRATQDSWVRAAALAVGIDPNAPGDPYGIWKAYNTWYPWAQWSDARLSKPAQGVGNYVKAPLLNQPVLNTSLLGR